MWNNDQAKWLSLIITIPSQNTTNSIVDQVVKDHAIDVIDMKEKVEVMCEAASKRIRRTTATTEAPGYSFFGDNVGKFSEYLNCGT